MGNIRLSLTRIRTVKDGTCKLERLEPHLILKRSAAPEFKYRVKYFLLIFLHGSIELVELYKTVYIKKFLNHFSEVKSSENYFENHKNYKKTHFFYFKEKQSILSIKLAFFIIFTSTDTSKYTRQM